MPRMNHYFAKIVVEGLSDGLSGPVHKAVQGILDIMAEGDEEQANVAKILERLFPLATTASANGQLNRVLKTFNDAARKADSSVCMEISAAKKVGAANRWVWFEGPAPAPRGQRTPELNDIPEGRLVPGQRGRVLHEPPTIVLLTVNPHETRALLDAFGEPSGRETRGGVTYNILGEHGGLRVVHCLCEMGSGGVGGSQSRVQKAISSWRARAVIAVGIAFGMDDRKQAFGDVLVSDHIRTYDAARVNKGGALTPRGDKPHASPTLLNRIVHLDQSLSERDKLERQWPRVRFGTILSGARLVDDLDYRESLRIQFETEAIGGEMEAAGVYVAAFEERVDWIVVKGICDFADGEKKKDKDKRQKNAAAHAARVVRLALEQPGLFPVRERPARPQEDEENEPPPGKDSCPWMPATRWMGFKDLDEVGPRVEEHARGRRASLHKDRQEDLEAESGAEVDTLEHLLSWAQDPGAPPLFALLGEYGMGKTISCQRLARRLEELRRSLPPAEAGRLPLPVYFDLRHVTDLLKGVPTLRDTVAQCVARGWSDQDRAFGYDQLVRLVDQGALVIFDGLDEVLVKLSEADGQAFTNHLVRLLTDALERRSEMGITTGPTPRLLISCRTQYFRSLREQKTHFTGQERGGPGAGAYSALLLLPFDEDQVRRYLAAALPEADPERLLATIRAVHNLEELAKRPYTLKLVAEFIPEIESERARGKTVRGVTLYRRTALRWLDRDQGKHHLKPEHKLRLVSHLAAEMARAGQSQMPVQRLEAWFHRWLAEQEDLRDRYKGLQPDQLEEDLRTATFLKRVDSADASADPTDGGFRFAHTSLYEFFLASFLLDAVRDDRPERWAIPRPSQETLDFLGQLFDEAGSESRVLLGTLQRWRHSYRPLASELILAYAQRTRLRGGPVPILHGMDLRGARLQGWSLGGPGDPPLELGPACLVGADLRQARLDHVKLEGADFSGALLDQAEWHDCKLARARFDEVQAPGALFRHCDLRDTGWEGARTWRARFVHSPLQALPAHAISAPQPAERRGAARLAPLGGHSNEINACAFSPDGRWLLSASDDKTLRLWDARSGECLRVLEGHSEGVNSCACSPDGRWLLSAGSDKTLRLWEAHSGECLRVLEGHSSGVLYCAFSPDGRWLFSAGFNKTLRLWDAHSGECLRVLEGHSDWVRSCAFSPDGRWLLSAGYDITLRLWDAHGGECLRILEGHSNAVLSCAFSPDGRWLLSAGHDATLRLWDAHSGECLRVLEGHCYQVLSCAFSPDGRWLLSAGEDKTVRLWDAHSGECLRVLEGHSDWVLSCAFSPDGRWLLSAGYDTTLRLWDAHSGECLRVLEGYSTGVLSCAFSPNGRWLLSAGDDKTLRLWDAHGGECLRVLEGHSNGVLSCAFSPDGRWLLSAGLDKTLRLWDAHSGECLRVLEGHSDWVLSCAFSPDGRWLLSAGDDKTLRFWDAQSGECLRVLEGHSNRVRSCAFSPDGQGLLSASSDKTLRLWDAQSGECLRVLEGHSNGVNSCAFSPDGRWLLSAGDDKTLRLWDAHSGECLRVLEGHSDRVLSCAFSPDGRWLLSAGSDNTLRLWDAFSGECLRVLEGHSDWVRSCAFSPDGRGLLSAGDDATLRLWDAQSGECLRIHAMLRGEHAVWEPAANHIVEASAEAWRWLQWQVLDDTDGWMPVPLESFGDPPTPQRLRRV